MEPLGKKLNSIDGIVKYYGILLAILMFVGFPIALFIPLGHGYNIFSFFFPAFLVASGFSAALLILLRKGNEKFTLLEICSGILFLSLLLSTLLNGSPGAEFLKYVGIALIPMSVALSTKLKTEFMYRIVKWGGGLLWLVNVIHCFSRLPTINVVGISGNQNWLAALILASAPFAVWLLKGFLAKYLKGSKVSFIVSFILIVGISLPILSAVDSRASYVALLLLPLYLLFILFGKKVKIGIATFVVLGAMTVPILLQKQISKENSQNIRIPLWTATLDMVSKHPLGVGPGNFESRFPEFVKKDQKVMLVSSETTLHPHNEFLYVLTLGGVPAGICWLILIGYALFYRLSNKEELYFKVPLFILAVQGMMDKPLFQMPTMLLFYLLVGVVLGKKDIFKVHLQKPERNKLGLYKAIAVIIILSFSYFTLMITTSSWYERQATIAEQKNDKAEALELYEKSYNYATWRLFPIYKAFLISTVDEPDVSRAIDFYDGLEARAPDYRQFNLLKGSFFTQLAMQDRTQMRNHLERAWTSYNRACELNASNILSFVDRLRFASRFLGPNELDFSYGELCKLYRFKAKASKRWLPESFMEWGTKWRKNKKYSEFLSSSIQVFNMMKPTYFHSLHFPPDMQALIPTFSGPLNIGDMVYATDSFTLIESLPKGDFAEQVSFLMSEIKVLEGAAFTWPKITLSNKSGSQISKLCLVAMVARNYGYDPLLDRGSGSLLLFKDDKFFVIDMTGLKQLNDTTLKSFSKGKVLEYFDYPQGFFYKNEFLSFILDEAGATPQYCRNPDYAINNLIKRLSGLSVKVAVVKEPFTDILKRMQQQNPQ